MATKSDANNDQATTARTGPVVEHEPGLCRQIDPGGDLVHSRTVRLSKSDNELLLGLAQNVYGGDQSAVLRHALRELAVEEQRRANLRIMLDEWANESGGWDQELLDEMDQAYFS